MKKLVCLVLMISLICSVTSMAFAAGVLISTQEFLLSFNYYAAISGLDHTLSLENAEISRFKSETLLKTVFNGCEILSLNTTPDSKDVESIHCTWATMVPGSSKYSNDFIYLLMEVLCACGLKTNTIADVLTGLGGEDSFDVGDSGEITVDGIKVSYTVTSSVGISFVIERA